MKKLSIATGVAAVALFATVSMASAAESDFHGYTKMPQSSGTHSYTPAPKSQNAPKTYSPYTAMPSGSVAQAPQPNSQSTPQSGSQNNSQQK
jgi:hypothetical protein